ncbi:MAG: type II toxin-antitoxin system VapC family toxin [Fibromonadaceae bacterium]|jgi:PIN domain nuclease of toxin-antitoxin system|nr:type II toxin-antitoxin system VapC family toxin [Fibromonadaceae bacterium]
MKYLLDTHTLIWVAQDTKKLSQKAKNIIIDESNEIYVSTISFWEIALKTSIGKFSFGNLDIDDFPKLSRKMGFRIIELDEQASITFHKLPRKENHKDPFDRMLVWQAITNDFVLISKDASIKQYKENGLNLVWYS